MAKFYIENKKSELRQSYSTLRTALSASQADSSGNSALADAIFEIERSNVTIMLVQHTATADTVTYYSRGNRFQDGGKDLPGGRDPQQRFDPLFTHYSPENWIERAKTLAVFDSAELPLLVSENTPSKPQPTLSLYGQAGDGVYIFLSTPQEPLALAASLGVQYNLYISLATFLLATILIYFISKRFTQPIQDIDQAARRISQMDFSQRSDVHTGDELEALSHSINLMADKLEA